MADHWLALIGPDGNIWLVNTGSGERKQITQDGVPQNSPTNPRTYYDSLSWSSDGKLLAFRSVAQVDTSADTQFQYAIWIYAVENDEARVVLQNAQPTHLAFRPGTHLLAFDQTLDMAYFTPGSGQPDTSKARGILAVDADTGETSVLVQPEHGLWLSVPRWSPDGNFLGFFELVSFENPTPFAVYDFQNKVYGAWNQVIGDYDFSPDGKQVAYDRLVNANGSERIWISDVWGQGEQTFSPPDGRMALGPVWTPQGDLLAYKLGEVEAAYQHDPGKDIPFTLMVQPAAGGEPRPLGSFIGLESIAWSPDGTRLAFSTGWTDPHVQVVLVADGAVADLGPGRDPAWQPASALPAVPPAGQSPLPASDAINLDVLMSFTYRVEDFNTQVTLQNGQFSDGQAQYRLIEPAAFGDLNGDGRTDAAVVLTTDPGGSGTFYDLIAVLDQDGIPMQAAFSTLGDRQAIKNLSIANGRVILDYLTQGPTSPLCCPDQHRMRSYLLENGALRLAGEQVLADPETVAIPLPNEILIDHPAEAAQLARPQVVTGRVSQTPPERKLTYAVTDINGVLLLQGEVPVNGEPGGPGIFAFEFTLPVLPSGLVQVEVVDAVNGILRGRSIVMLIAP